MGSIVIALVLVVVCLSISLFSPSLNISETAHLLFLKILLEVWVNKIRQDLLKKNLIWVLRGMNCQKLVLGAFFRKQAIESFSFWTPDLWSERFL